MNGDVCSVEECPQKPVAVYYVRWTERHQHYNRWPTCLDHQTLIQFNLITGKWSGGVKPLEFHTNLQVIG